MALAPRATEHGGFITEGTISHGTLRSQDLLRAFAVELGRLAPFGTQRLCAEAFDMADAIDADRGFPFITAASAQDVDGVLEELTDEINRLVYPHGFWFGTLEGDGSDFGIWRNESDEGEDA